MRWTGLFETVADLQGGAERVRRWRCGMIEARDGRWRRIELRPWPRWISGWEVAWQTAQVHRRQAGDRCLLFYRQPWGHSRYLALQYALSWRDTRLATLLAAMQVLDHVAWLKQSDALLCEVTSQRVSERVLRRGGWEAHCPGRRGRHYIKRFYGRYPRAAETLAWPGSPQKRG